MLLVIVPLLVFQHVRAQDFVKYDDNDHVYNNQYLNPVTAANVLHFWQEPYHKLYIPLSYTVYALITLIARMPVAHPQIMDSDTDLNSHVFHLVNLILHLANVLLVFGILRLLIRRNNGASATSNFRDWPAAVGALLFAIHPVQVESVAWISELRGLLSSAFCLLAIRLSLNLAEVREAETPKTATRRMLAVAAPIAMALAVLCKPNAVMLPLLILALDHWALGRSWRKNFVLTAPLFAVSLIFAVITQIVQPPNVGATVPLWQRPLVAGDALAFYLGKLVFPRDLGINYGRSPEFIMKHWWGFATWLVPAALGVLIWLRRKSTPWLVAAYGVFITALLPVLGFIRFDFQFASTVTDRYLYLALLGPAYGVSVMLAKRNNLAINMACCALLAVLGWTSIVQTRTWDNTYTLVRNGFQIYPSSPDFYNQLGILFSEQGKTGQSTEIFRDILRYNPNYPDARFGLAVNFMQSGNFGEAIPEIRAFIKLEPQSEDAHFRLATALFQVHSYSEGLAEFREAVRLRPDSASYHATLGSALASFGKRDEAISELREALRLQPDYPAAQHLLSQLLPRNAR